MCLLPKNSCESKKDNIQFSVIPLISPTLSAPAKKDGAPQKDFLMSFTVSHVKPSDNVEAVVTFDYRVNNYGGNIDYDFNRLCTNGDGLRIACNGEVPPVRCTTVVHLPITYAPANNGNWAVADLPVTASDTTCKIFDPVPFTPDWLSCHRDYCKGSVSVVLYDKAAKKQVTGENTKLGGTWETDGDPTSFHFKQASTLK
jgi:hypothetical protein